MEANVREPSVTDLFGEILGDVQRLVRDEIRLARVELTQSLRAVAAGLAALVAVGMFTVLAVAFIGVAIFFALGLVIPLWGAGLTVFGLYVIAAVIAGIVAYQLLKPSRLRPRQTIESLEEDREWLERERERVSGRPR